MAVPEYMRSLGRLKVITSAYKNCVHTLTVCKSEKNFPKRDRWILTNRIIDAANGILQCCIMANNINVKTASDYELRRQYQMQAKGHAMNQLALMRLAFEVLSLEISEEHWIQLVDDVITLLTGWMDSDRRKHDHLLKDS